MDKPMRLREAERHPRPRRPNVPSPASVAWCHFGLIAAVLATIRYLGDSWRIATLICYGPRWPWALPLIPLALWAMRRGRAAMVPVALTALLTAGPLLGFVIPWRLLGGGPAREKTVLLSLNAQGGGVDRDGLRSLIESSSADLVVLQEWPAGSPPPLPDPKKWSYVARDDLLIASRYGIRSHQTCVDPLPPGRTLAIRCDIEAPGGPMSVVDLHLETPRRGINAICDGWSLDGSDRYTANYRRRRWESMYVAGWARSADPARLVVGDFNMPCDSPIFGRSWSNYIDAFSASGWGRGATKFTRFHGIRIDHVLASDAWEVQACRVGTDLGSDHRPVIVALARVPKVRKGGR